MSHINCNEFSSLSDALSASRELPYCGECKTGAKLHMIGGRYLLLCAKRPMIHHGLSDWRNNEK